MTHTVRVWDPLVRLFHWSLAVLFIANSWLIPGDYRAHIFIGYGVMGLVFIRLIWGVIGTRFARFSSFPLSLSAARKHAKEMLERRRGELHLSHNPLGALMIYNMLITLVLISITGLMADSNAFWGVDWVKELHELVANYLAWCVGLHLIGVVWETRQTKVNLVRAMVTGDKEIPGTGR